MYQKGIELATLHEQLYPSDGSPGLPVGDKRSKVAQAQANLLKWFSEQPKDMKELFKKQMKVK